MTLRNIASLYPSPSHFCLKRFPNNWEHRHCEYTDIWEDEEMFFRAPPQSIYSYKSTEK